MIKIAIGGQLSKSEIKEAIEKSGREDVTAEIFTDMNAAKKVKSGEFDYYIGACQSGAGGALGMAYGILGRDKCVTIGMAGRPPKENKVQEAIDKGAKAFGFTSDQVDPAVPLLMKLLP